MSPEQARGREIDSRTDVWAFGCVLFEMLTGRSTFAGDDVSLTLARVLERQPDLSALPPNLHSRIVELLERCLEKEAINRYTGIADARVDIQKVLADPSGVQPAAEVVQAKARSRVPWAVATVALVSLTALAYVHFSEQRAVIPSYRFQVGIPPGGLTGSMAISPDGLQVAFIARNSDGINQVWVRPLETDAFRALDGTEGAARTVLSGHLTASPSVLSLSSG